MNNPHASTPQVSTPQVSTPQVSSPQASSPQASTPGTDTLTHPPITEIESQIISKYFEIINTYSSFNKEILAGVNTILQSPSTSTSTTSTTSTSTTSTSTTSTTSTSNTTTLNTTTSNTSISPSHTLGIMDPLTLQLQYLELLLSTTPTTPTRTHTSDNKENHYKQTLSKLHEIERYLSSLE